MRKKYTYNDAPRPYFFYEKALAFFAVVSVITGLTIFLFYVHPARIILAIGVNNIYIATFLLAIIGGVSAFTATSFYAALFAFALGGANPFLLALFSAPGVLIPRWFIPVGVYIYTGFLPLPGEFLMVLLALLGISFKRVLIPTLLGNFTLALIVSSSAVYGLAFADLIF
ncbi:MAG: hypothetical protein UX06_C0032G0005 [Candidatus Giovannonibacteria bacterium GW2011_GWA2_45_21]|uniref:Uncharacterized protein n=1 Tax=Candidatus Giovannonibacteria bacterium GW2011_GWA2_45_21 TaxID=1618649 RepID=A0A0G1Q5D8_9BACT|nr:MAG: hypothetical protein UX06_C0032G0005 [Candidatus Giovannonibacteria bacterium GW2011_GWA2_45_21]